MPVVTKRGSYKQIVEQFRARQQAAQAAAARGKKEAPKETPETAKALAALKEGEAAAVSKQETPLSLEELEKNYIQINTEAPENERRWIPKDVAEKLKQIDKEGYDALIKGGTEGYHTVLISREQQERLSAVINPDRLTQEQKNQIKAAFGHNYIMSGQATQDYVAAYAKKYGMTTDQAWENLAGEIGVSVDDFKQIIADYRLDPMNFKIVELGGDIGITAEQLNKIAAASGMPSNIPQQYSVAIREGFLVPVGRKLSLGTFQRLVIQEYADAHDMTWQEAKNTIDIMRKDHNDPKLKNLSASDKNALLGVITRLTKGMDYVPKSEYEKLREAYPSLAETLSKGGLKAFITQFERAKQIREAKYRKAIEDFEKNHVQIQGKWYDRQEVENLKNKSPELYDILESKGYNEYKKALDAMNYKTLFLFISEKVPGRPVIADKYQRAEYLLEPWRNRDETYNVAEALRYGMKHPGEKDAIIDAVMLLFDKKDLAKLQYKAPGLFGRTIGALKPTEVVGDKLGPEDVLFIGPVTEEVRKKYPELFRGYVEYDDVVRMVPASVLTAAKVTTGTPTPVDDVLMWVIVGGAIGTGYLISKITAFFEENKTTPTLTDLALIDMSNYDKMPIGKGYLPGPEMKKLSVEDYFLPGPAIRPLKTEDFILPGHELKPENVDDLVEKFQGTIAGKDLIFLPGPRGYQEKLEDYIMASGELITAGKELIQQMKTTTIPVDYNKLLDQATKERAFKEINRAIEAQAAKPAVALYSNKFLRGIPDIGKMRYRTQVRYLQNMINTLELEKARLFAARKAGATTFNGKNLGQYLRDIQHSLKTHQEYLIKLRIWQDAWKQYVSSVNPEPVKGGKISEAMRAVIATALLTRPGDKPVKKKEREWEPVVERIAREYAESGAQLKAMNEVIRKAINAYNNELKSQIELKTSLELAHQLALKQALKTALQTLTQTKTKPRLLTKEEVRTAVQEAIMVLPIVAPLTLSQVFEGRSRLKTKRSEPLSERKKRQLISDANGALAWKQGEVFGKGGERIDRWDVIVNPYSDDEHYFAVYGRPPRGATIIKRGKGSAMATAQMLYGKPPKKPITVDSGFEDIHISAKGKRINARWEPDPNMETVSDISIGSSAAKPISERLRPISASPKPIDKGGKRISPPMKPIENKPRRLG